MKRLVRILVGASTAAKLVMGRGRRKRIVPPGDSNRRAENAVLALLFLASACSVTFIWIYATEDLPSHTQFLGLSLGGALVFLAAAFIVAGKKLVVAEEKEEEYPEPEHPGEQVAITQIVRESGSGITRKRLLGGAAGATAGAVGAAFLAPAGSLGPSLNTNELLETPWRRGTRLVDEHREPMRAEDIETDTFYTAFAEDAPSDQIGSPLVLVRIEPEKLRLPRARRDWAPEGILAYSKICTHAGCAISLYRTPKFEPTEPGPALVCPCHYSTFDPTDGGTVKFGPAGRNLPQLPLEIDADGYLRAAGNLSGPPGPSWWGVRMWKARFRSEPD